MSIDAMKFVLKKVRNGGCRLGAIMEAGRHGDKTFATPMCMVYTRKGSAPYLTKDMLSKIPVLPSCVHMPLTLLVEHEDQIIKYNKGLANYAALEDKLVFTTLQDSATLLPPGYNGKKTVVVWGKGGKVTVDVPRYMKLQEGCKPDWFTALSDGDTDDDMSKKKVHRLVDKTLDYLDQCVAAHEKSEDLKNSEIFGVIEGGYDLEERARSAKETALRPVAGFVVEGFHNFGPESESFNMTNIRPFLQKIWESLPDDKPRIMHSVWTPKMILEGVENGIDIFDSSFPYVVTERNSALVFDYKVFKDPEGAPNGNDKPVTSTERPYEIDFADKRYADDFSPILHNCSCFTCKHHTKAYLNHLVNTKELLGGVLFMIHNFHHYFGFFEEIRKALQDNSFDQLKKVVSQSTDR